MSPIKVLSLFDGISCGRIALSRAGIPVESYHASEIDKYAISVSKYNWSEIVHIGPVQDIQPEDYQNVDLLFGGFPCQNYSLAGNQKGPEGTSGKLFFELLRLHKEINPKWFLYENVKMKKEYQDFISEQLGTQPRIINSNLVSAQNRTRLYWTNIPIGIIEDRNILLADIIEDGETEKNKSYCIDANYFKGTNPEQYIKKCRRQIIWKQLPRWFINKGMNKALDKSPTVSSSSFQYNNFILENEEVGFRKLTVTECERLQTLPDGYTQVPGNSKSQSYKQIGNGWTVDVIVEILKGIKE